MGALGTFEKQITNYGPVKKNLIWCKIKVIESQTCESITQTQKMRALHD